MGMRPHSVTLNALIIGATLLLGACDMNTGPKSIGNGTNVTNTTAKNAPDSIVIRFAYHDPASTTNLVFMQGSSDPNASLLDICKSDASNCTCDFYLNSSDTSPTTSSEVTYSERPNLVTCKISLGGTHTASDYKYVRMRQLSSTKATGLFNIETSLTLSEVIGSDLDTKNVRSIWNYTCTRYFFQGDGVAPTGLDCSRSNFYLSTIEATYNYYYYQNSQIPADTNNVISATGRSPTVVYFGQNITDGSGTPANICNLAAPQKQIACASSGTKTYGLYNQQTTLFPVSVTLAPGPGKAAVPVGYAALADGTGTCPAGLVKIGNYIARPKSEVIPPSTFINDNFGENNNNQFEPIPYSSSSTLPPAFAVIQNLNSTKPCTNVANVGYTCYTQVDSTSQLQTVTYDQSGPYICGIPKGLVP